jgi:hypothetical protein
LETVPSEDISGLTGVVCEEVSTITSGIRDPLCCCYRRFLVCNRPDPAPTLHSAAMAFQGGIIYETALRDPDIRRTLRSYDQCRRWAQVPRPLTTRRPRARGLCRSGSSPSWPCREGHLAAPEEERVVRCSPVRPLLVMSRQVSPGPTGATRSSGFVLVCARGLRLYGGRVGAVVAAVVDEYVDNLGTPPARLLGALLPRTGYCIT